MAYTLPTKTGAPLLADNNYQNTIDFHVAATTFLKILDSYLNEVATGYAHNFSQYTVDPITKEAQFFVNLNNGTLDLTTLESGINPNIAGTLTVKIDSKLLSNEIWKTDETNTVNSRLNNGVIEWLAISTQSNTTRWVPIEQNVIDLVKKYTSQLKTNYNIKQMNDEFILYWIEKFQTAHELVKQTYKNIVTDSTQDMFTNFSDSIGILARISENIDTTVIPLSDPDFSISNVIPRSYNAILDDKIDSATKSMALQMNIFNSVLFRLNLIKVINTISTSSVTHGENLVTDELDYKRVLKIVDDLNGYVATTLGTISRIIYYMRTLPDINQQEIVNFSYNAVVEESIVLVDTLKNKVQQLQSNRTSILSLSAQ
jgi:hypothetical protein